MAKAAEFWSAWQEDAGESAAEYEEPLADENDGEADWSDK